MTPNLLFPPKNLLWEPLGIFRAPLGAKSVELGWTPLMVVSIFQVINSHLEVVKGSPGEPQVFIEADPDGHGAYRGVYSHFSHIAKLPYYLSRRRNWQLRHPALFWSTAWGGFSSSLSFASPMEQSLWSTLFMTILLLEYLIPTPAPPALAHHWKVQG